MGLVDELYLIVLIGAALNYGPDCEYASDQVFLVTVGVNAFLVLLSDFGCKF